MGGNPNIADIIMLYQTMDVSNSGTHGIRTWILDIEQPLKNVAFLEQHLSELL